MSEHICFDELEFDTPVDQSHLETCDECRRKWRLYSFLRTQTKTAPQIDAPPVFAAKVSQLAQTTTFPFLSPFQRAARHLVPVFVCLILLTSFLLFNLTHQPSLDPQTDVLFYQPPEQDISLEYVVNSLREQPLEEPH